MSDRETLEWLEHLKDIETVPAAVEALNVAIAAVKAKSNQWTKIIFRPLTEEEKEKYPEGCDGIYDCNIPEDGQDVLITTLSGYVVVDTFCRDCDGCYFETYCDTDDVKAWMPFPEPYKEDE